MVLAVSPYFTDSFSFGGPGGTNFTAQGTSMSLGPNTTSSPKYGSGGRGAKGGQILSGGSGGTGPGFVEGPNADDGVSGVVIIITYA